MMFSMIFLTIHKISYYKVRVSTVSVETHWLGGSFLMVYRNNAGRLGSGFISVRLETRWVKKAVSMSWNDPVLASVCLVQRTLDIRRSCAGKKGTE